MRIKHGTTPDSRRVEIELLDGLYYRMRTLTNANHRKEWRQASANVICHANDLGRYIDNYIQTGFVTRHPFIGDNPNGEANGIPTSPTQTR